MQLHQTAQGQAFVIYPDGGTSAPVWQFPGGANVTDPQRDLNFFDAMVELVGDQYCIDGNHIFSTGFSQGAFFSNALGCERPWMVAGIAPVGGGGPWQCSPAAMAAMVIIGTADDVSGANNPYGYENSAQKSRDFWLDGNGCAQTTTPFDPSPCVAYDCPDRPVVYCEFNGGHTWWANASVAMMLFFDGL
jgi:poly(3-hydroxybutyrate) depolymerase